jgi:phosphopantetheine binding protein
MTGSGKIDRRALPEPSKLRGTLDAPFIAPRNELENVLSQLWREVLQVDEVGCDDDFAALGGDSLLATRIVTQVNQLFESTRPLKTLFAAPTVAQLASWLTAQELAPGAAAETARLLLAINAMSPAEIEQALADDQPKHNG